MPAYFPERIRQSDISLFVHFGDAQQDYATAQATCKSNGMSLGHVIGDSSRSDLIKLFTNSPTLPQFPVWIGARTYNGYLALGMTNAPAVNTYWAANSPTLSSYCVYSSRDTGLWVDSACTITRRFVCSGVFVFAALFFYSDHLQATATPSPRLPTPSSSYI